MTRCCLWLWCAGGLALTLALILTLALAGAAVPARAGERFITLQSTSSTQHSGLYDAILPQFTDQTGIVVRVVAVGTGQALRNGSNCDGDVLVVHARAAEEAFVAAGHATGRWDVMYNDFVLIGPEADPARVAKGTEDMGEEDVLGALRRIARAQAIFVSRGDDSGTHRRERSLWQQAGLAPAEGRRSWYREAGAGMGPVIQTTIGLDGYTLTDRASWLSFRRKRSHRIVLEGDARLFNQYGILPISPDRCPNVKAGLAGQFRQWLLGPAGQKAIGAFRLQGQQLFYPNATGTGTPE